MVVIGAGPAGEKGAAQAAYHSKQVAIVERSTRPGGAGALNSWVPSKTLREAALYLTGYGHRDVYEGLHLNLDPTIAITRLRARSEQVIAAVTGQVRTNLDAHGIELVHGEAQLGADRTVHVVSPDGGRRVLEADVVLIATGSRPFHPDGITFDADVLDSATVLEVDRPVASLVVIGGGAVGCEYASIFGALGAQVTLIDSGSRLVSVLDDQVSAGLAEALRGMGVRVVLDSGRVSVARDAGELTVSLPNGEQLRPEKVLFAAGRVGNTEGLALGDAGIDVDERGRIKVDGTYRTSAPGVYAAGDVLGPPALASVSMEQARVAVCHTFGIPFKQAVDTVTPIGVYSIPEAAAVGRDGTARDCRRHRLRNRRRTVRAQQPVDDLGNDRGIRQARVPARGPAAAGRAHPRRDRNRAHPPCPRRAAPGRDARLFHPGHVQRADAE